MPTNNDASQNSDIPVAKNSLVRLSYQPGGHQLHAVHYAAGSASSRWPSLTDVSVLHRADSIADNASYLLLNPVSNAGCVYCEPPVRVAVGLVRRPAFSGERNCLMFLCSDKLGSSARSSVGAFSAAEHTERQSSLPNTSSVTPRRFNSFIMKTYRTYKETI